MWKIELTALSSFVLTGLLANWLIQQWQQVNWYNQHKVQGAVKEFEELRKVIDELMTLSCARHYRMRRIVLNARGATKESIKGLMDDYTHATTAWNDKLTPLSIGLRVFANSRYVDQLEVSIQEPFVAIGGELEQLVKQIEKENAISSNKLADLNRQLNSLSGEIYNFSSALIRELQSKQRRAYEGERVVFNEKNLKSFSSWYLFKALFQSRKYPHPVSGPLLDFLPPTFIRPQWSRENEHGS